jgi:hypothetical protein
MPERLDAHAASGCRTPVLMDELTRLVDTKTLWTDYGINDNIIVSAR